LAVDAESRISWAEGWIAFEGETAGQAVRAFNRFSEVRVEITRPELSRMRVKYGRFEFDKPESFADNLANVLGAPVTSKRNVIYIGGPRKPE
jgi:ferric-dicitrate binding protein FerR (iron transport regulator)